MGLLIGLGAGLFGGLLGIGGGFIMIPLMVRFMRVRQHVAHGTSLAVLVFIGLSGALSYALKGSLDIAAFLLLAATSVVTAYFGARVAHALPEQLLKRFFGAFLLFVAIFMLLKPHLWSAAFAPALRYRVVVLAHFRLGNVKARLIGQLVTGVIAGSFLGGTFAHLFPENALRSLFGIVLVWTAWRYLAPGRWVGEGGTNADK
ncbi:MAG: sulfite exporter TauE/SafE family protein [Nitrospirota bacterium]